MKAFTIVFDLDGTLVDTAPDLVHAMNHVMERISAPSIDPAIARTWISHGARHMITQALAHTNLSKSDLEIDDLLTYFLAHYTLNIARESKPFPGVAPLLDALRRKNFKLAICTNKREALARQLLAELKLTSKFDAIAGRDTFPVCKPDPGHVTSTVTMAGGNPRNAIMIGDSANDINAARNADIPSVAVTFGYSKTRPEDLGADALIDHMSDLETVIETLIARVRAKT